MTVNSWTTLSQETIDKNVSVLYHPGLVEGMKLVHGYTVEFPTAYTADHLASIGSLIGRNVTIEGKLSFRSYLLPSNFQYRIGKKIDRS